MGVYSTSDELSELHNRMNVTLNLCWDKLCQMKKTERQHVQTIYKLNLIYSFS